VRTTLGTDDAAPDLGQPGAAPHSGRRPAASRGRRSSARHSSAPVSVLTAVEAVSPAEATLTPFPRHERALAASAIGEAAVEIPALPSADPFHELAELRRRHRATTDAAVHADSDGLRDVRRRERIYRRLLGLADAVMALVAVAVTFEVIGGYGLRPLALVLAPLIVLAAKVGGLYDKDELVIEHSTLNELPRLINLAAMTTLLVWLARHYLVIGAPGTRSLLELWILLTLALVLGRSSARELARRRAPVERCLLVGRPSVLKQLECKLASYPRVRMVGRVRTEEVAGDHRLLREIAERDQVHRIIIDTDASSPAAVLGIVRAANATGLQVSLLPSMLAAVGGSVVFDDVGGLVLMGVPRFGLSRSSQVLKRTFDVTGATFVLLFAAPVMAAIAVAVKFGSPGPVLFRQMRVGRDGQPFQMLKFRSMVDGADALKEELRERNEAEGLFKIEADPRITRIGRLLRRTGLDELPQLFNVLGGDMSLVGPRPLVLDEDLRVTGFDRHRLHLTPGITGRWQTLGAARIPLEEMVKIDYLYIANWSPWADFKIMVETVGYLARRRGQ
jgi:exopolysaccharide biosynthesis polyprenyl glycosylphosphotransferase